MTERDEDALWRSIVENYGERVTLEPTAEENPPPAAPEKSEPGLEGLPENDPRAVPDWLVEEEHYEPPEAPPLPRPEPPRLLAWAGVFGVPVLTIVLTAMNIEVPPWGSLLGLAWFIGGFGYLVATMRRDPADPDDSDDDGAVI